MVSTSIDAEAECPGAISQKVHKQNYDKIVKSLDFDVKIWYNIYVPKREREK